MVGQVTPTERTAGRTPGGWDGIDWPTCERTVRRLQERIFLNTQRGQWKAVKNLQKLLARSESAKLLAIRRVTQDNKGRTTPGIDGKIYLTSDARWEWSQGENFGLNGYRPKPAKRAYIPKSSGGRRPLGIPVMRDRAVEAIGKLALEAEWEARFETNSYGFRPGRSCHDAIEQVRYCVKRKVGGAGNPVVLDADIAGCFDNIAHEPLLSRIPVFKGVVRRWLKAGVVEMGHYEPTEAGTPQGGVISPLLANIALDGMERLFGCEDAAGNYVTPSYRPGNRGISLVRYADDFLVFARNPYEVEWYIRPKLQKFLAARGLTLSDAKTRVATRAEGFNFLGFTVRQVWTKYNKLLLVVPQKEKVHHLLARVREILSTHKQGKPEVLVKLLNPVIRGWAQYYSHCHAKQTLAKVDHRIFQAVWRWCVRRHSNKGKRWIKVRYFHTVGKRHWVFGENGCNLLLAQSVPITKHVKVKGRNSPLDPALKEYWARRAQKAVHDDLPSEIRKKVVEAQENRCAGCHLPFEQGDAIHLHHLTRRNDGGSSGKSNLCAVHSRCHVLIHRYPDLFTPGKLRRRGDWGGRGDAPE